MANEVTVTVQGTLRNGSLVRQFSPSARQIDQASKLVAAGVVSIGTTAEAIPFGDVTSPGYCFLQNLDDTNFIEFGPDSGGTLVVLGKLLPGEPAGFPLGTTTLKAKADTAAALASYEIWSR